MCYRGLDDPWILRLRKSPHAALLEIMPNLEKAIGRFEVAGQMRIRPADLTVTEGYLQPGIVLVGDAFSTSCPAAGTGAGKVLTDVACLCNIHIPNWLKSDGMGTDKLAAFYDDPSKCAYDTGAINRAFELRAISSIRPAGWPGAGCASRPRRHGLLRRRRTADLHRCPVTRAPRMSMSEASSAIGHDHLGPIDISRQWTTSRAARRRMYS
jgi:hypothetical protein